MQPLADRARPDAVRGAGLVEAVAVAVADDGDGWCQPRGAHQDLVGVHRRHGNGRRGRRDRYGRAVRRAVGGAVRRRGGAQGGGGRGREPQLAYPVVRHQGGGSVTCTVVRQGGGLQDEPLVGRGGELQDGGADAQPAAVVHDLRGQLDVVRGERERHGGHGLQQGAVPRAAPGAGRRRGRVPRGAQARPVRWWRGRPRPHRHRGGERRLGPDGRTRHPGEHADRADGRRRGRADGGRGRRRRHLDAVVEELGRHVAAGRRRRPASTRVQGVAVDPGPRHDGGRCARPRADG